MTRTGTSDNRLWSRHGRAVTSRMVAWTNGSTRSKARQDAELRTVAGVEVQEDGRQKAVESVESVAGCVDLVTGEGDCQTGQRPAEDQAVQIVTLGARVEID